MVEMMSPEELKAFKEKSERLQAEYLKLRDAYRANIQLHDYKQPKEEK